MLRWRRFCEHSDTIEKLFSVYRERLDQINADFQDFKNRAQRLSVAHHSFVMGDKKAFARYYFMHKIYLNIVYVYIQNVSDTRI